MLAPRNRGALVSLTLSLGMLAVACSNGTELRQSPCNPADALSLNVGEVRTNLIGGCVYLASASSGAEFALVPFNTDTMSSRAATLSLTTSGVSAVTTPLQSRERASQVARSSGALPGSTQSSSLALDNEFEVQLRESERHLLTPLIPAARAWYARRTRSGVGAPVRLGLRPPSAPTATTWAVGDTVALNTNTGNSLAAACTTTVLRQGRVAAVSNTAIVVDDINNPAGGYTDADYLTIATKFDTVYAMDASAFGTPTDIDANGKVILFFTRAVNELTPAGSQELEAGFFYGRDLFPKTDSPQLGAGSGCPASNVAEMMYLLVPDPNGVVNGNVRTKLLVSHLTVSTTAHELQHLINAARRLYVNTAATAFEVVWLNEGLSHIAEELLFYKQSSSLAPRMDIDSLRFMGSQQNIDAYNYDEQSNIGRFRSYLAAPSTSAPYAPDGNLSTRGATWTFLRYAADHRGTSDADTWFKLVNSTTEGLPNLQNVFGSDLTAMFRDWAIASIADDVPGVAAEWQHPSWNFRSLFDFISTAKQYPLATVTVADGSPLALSLNGGSTAYVRFTIAAGQVGSLTWSPSTSTVTMSLVRLK